MLDSASEYQPQTDTSSSDIVPQHRYNLRLLPNRRLSATDSSTPNFSALSSNSALRLLRQHAQPLSSESPHSSEYVPQSYFTSGVDTASLISFDVQTAYLSGNLSSEVLVPTPVSTSFRIAVIISIESRTVSLRINQSEERSSTVSLRIN